VLDCTASVPIARCLSAGEFGNVRTVSLFLNPAGDALILLAEDAQRACRMDWLEMQYYRAVAQDDALAAHLRTHSKTRYSNACRSVTSRVSQESMGIFAAIGSRGFRQSATSDEASISIWQVKGQMAVERTEISAEPVIAIRIRDWTVCTDEHLLDVLRAVRASRLPLETGGVLIGSYDMQRQIIYVVDMLPSPPDSEEWPSSYRRGSYGLRQRLTDIGERTLQNIEYIGEWHSHPDNYGVCPSLLDDAALIEISSEMGKAGLPGLMLIVGQNGEYGFHLGAVMGRSDRV